MYIVIAGAGRVGGRLATDLAEAGNDVVVIDNRGDALDALGRDFNGISITGEAYDVDILKEAQLGRADVFCAMTDDDNTNLMAVEVAKAVYDVPRVVARLHDPAREESYRALGIPHISTTALIASVAYESIVSEEFAVHVTFSGGDVEVIEFNLSEGVEGMTVADLQVDRELRVAAIRRGDRTIVPTESERLRAGDLIVAAAHHGVRRQIERFIDNGGAA
jgi:trk system potassium uptake protein TrkA